MDQFDFFVLDSGRLTTGGADMFGPGDPASWISSYPTSADLRCQWAVKCLLVHFGKRWILVDTGLGEFLPSDLSREYEIQTHDLVSQMKQVGADPLAISDVILTHLHFDHCGGNLVFEDRQWKSRFPNATFRVSSPQWESALNPVPAERDSFLPDFFKPLAALHQLELVNTPGYIFPGLELRFFFGHTQGLMLPFFHTPAGVVAFAGDLIPSEAHFLEHHTMAYDVDPLTSQLEKMQFLQEAQQGGYRLFLQHDIRQDWVSF